MMQAKTCIVNSANGKWISNKEKHSMCPSCYNHNLLGILCILLLLLLCLSFYYRTFIGLMWITNLTTSCSAPLFNKTGVRVVSVPSFDSERSYICVLGYQYCLILWFHYFIWNCSDSVCISVFHYITILIKEEKKRGNARMD